MDQEFEKIEKVLSQLSDMERLDPCDRLSKLVQKTMDADDSELDEHNLELVSAARQQPYQKFLKRIGKQTGPS